MRSLGIAALALAAQTASAHAMPLTGSARVEPANPPRSPSVDDDTGLQAGPQRADNLVVLPCMTVAGFILVWGAAERVVMPGPFDPPG